MHRSGPRELLSLVVALLIFVTACGNGDGESTTSAGGDGAETVEADLGGAAVDASADDGSVDGDVTGDGDGGAGQLVETADDVAAAVDDWRTAGGCPADQAVGLGFRTETVGLVRSAEQDPSIAGTVADRATIVLVECGRGTSAIAATVLFLVDGVLVAGGLSQYGQDGEFFQDDLLVLDGLEIIDGTPSRMVVFQKDRGTGGCGTLAEYGIYGSPGPDGPPAFFGLELVRRQSCEDFDNGLGAAAPEEWPIVYSGP